MSTATSAVAAATHQIPPFVLPSLPRVRPPPIPKGTPSPNSKPQPPGPVPKGKVWVQGQWREPSSSAAKQWQQVQSRRVEKALRHEVHGLNIYAYCHIRTHQVVYSLTRVMNNTKILEQLQYHGKKTVPAALRRDMWTPYFSVHFPATSAGASAGLLAYHRLRELSLRRQLKPPDELVITTAADIQKLKAKYDPIDLGLLLRSKKIYLPQIGQLLPKELRAKKLMDQKASSVADVARVLELLRKKNEDPVAREERRLKGLRERGKGRTRRYKRRLQTLDAEKQKKEEELEKRRALVEIVDGNEGQLPLDKHAQARISMEYQGVLTDRGEVKDLALIDEIKEVKEDGTWFPPLPAEEKRPESAKAGENPVAPKSPPSTAREGEEALEAGEQTEEDHIPLVKILWADMRDGTYAERWPEHVQHAELEREAVVKNDAAKVISTSVHVIGSQQGSDWWLSPEQISKAVKSGELKKMTKVLEKQVYRLKEMIEQELPRVQLMIDDIVVAFAQIRLGELASEELEELEDRGHQLSENKEKISELRERASLRSRLLDSIGQQSPLIEEHLDRLSAWVENIDLANSERISNLLKTAENGEMNPEATTLSQELDTFKDNLEAFKRSLESASQRLPDAENLGVKEGWLLKDGAGSLLPVLRVQKLMEMIWSSSSSSSVPDPEAEAESPLQPSREELRRRFARLKSLYPRFELSLNQLDQLHSSIASNEGEIMRLQSRDVVGVDEEEAEREAAVEQTQDQDRLKESIAQDRQRLQELYASMAPRRHDSSPSSYAVGGPGDGAEGSGAAVQVVERPLSFWERVKRAVLWRR